MTAPLARVDRLWRCTRCGYFAYSPPYGTLYDDDGQECGGFNDPCPKCGEEDWHWCGGDSREQREQALRLSRAPEAREGRGAQP